MVTDADILNRARYYLNRPTLEQPDGSNHVDGITTKFWDDFWCDMFVSVVMSDVGLPMHEASCIHTVGEYRAGRLGSLVGTPRPADQAFYGKNGGEHTGIVEAVNGTSMVCIDGNWGNRVTRVNRHVSDAAYFGRRPYTVGAPVVASHPTVVSHPAARRVLFLRHPDMTGLDVAYLQGVLITKASQPLVQDGDFGPKTDRSVRALQTIAHLTVDGQVGPQTWATVDHLAGR